MIVYSFFQIVFYNFFVINLGYYSDYIGIATWWVALLPEILDLYVKENTTSIIASPLIIN